MTHACCPDCRLRFTPAASAYLAVCPQCGEPPRPITSLQGAFGFRLFTSDDLCSTPLPEALAVSIPIPDPNTGRPR